MTTRPYQQDGINALLDAMRDYKALLLQAATGAGKTEIFCHLIKTLISKYPEMRVLILVHRRELVTQAADRLRRLWPEAPLGVACSSTGAPVDTDAQIVVGSPQTLGSKSRISSLPLFHLVVIDEAHRLPPKNVESMYSAVIKRLESYYPQLRIIGVTATPFRLGHGYIYGPQCRWDHENWFDKLHYQISIGRLQEMGYLCQMRALEAANIDDDLAGIRLVGGEFSEGQLGALMSRSVHIESAVYAYKEYAAGRTRTVVYCVTIEHVKLMADAFTRSGIPAKAVHSQMPLNERDAILAEFRAGKIPVVANVGILTEGWDCPEVDCMLLCRPTMSPALYIQMIGRGLRPAPGKLDLLILDLSGNCRRHGHPDAPKVTWAKKKSGPINTVIRNGRLLCQKCLGQISSVMIECPHCGELLRERADPTAMNEVSWAGMRLTANVVGSRISEYTSASGNKGLRVTVLAQPDNTTIPIAVHHYMMFTGGGILYARQSWAKIAKTMPPASPNEAVARKDELRIPAIVTLTRDGKHWRVEGW